MTRVSVSVAMVALCAIAVPRAQHPQDTSCGNNIVSATVVASYCAHVENGADHLDLLVLWRGRPGWFRRSAGVGGSGGSGGSQWFGGGFKSQISRRDTYGETTIAFLADFESRMVVIDGTRIGLETVNAVFVDRVDEPGARTFTHHQLEPRVELGIDPHLVLARRSSQVRDFLQCQIPLPPVDGQQRQPAVVTVCDKLRQR